jgi:hypothetical protein
MLAFFLASGYKGSSTKKGNHMAKSSKYTPEMVAIIEDAAATHGSLNLELCNELATMPVFADAGITPRGIIAKVRTMGIDYTRKQRVTKTGAPVIRKDEIVVKIENVLGVSGLDSLSKAEKPALHKLLQAITENA